MDVAELDAIIDAAASGPLDEEQRQTLRSALHLLLAKLEPKGRTSERLEELIKKLMPQDKPDSDDKSTGQEKPGHGRNPSSAYWGAQRFVITHGTLQAGSHCPDCATGKVYPTKTPKTLLSIVAAPPVQAKAYDLERLRCNLCGETFVAEAPEGVGDKKYDATVPAMLAVLTYGSGFPRNRLTTLQGQLGVPMPQSTQWDLLDEAADQLEPLYREVVEHAAQGDVLHSDDTSRKVLKLERPPEDARTGVFTSGIVSTANGHGPRIALFFTGRQHAGENLRDILLRRAQELAQPLHMCDALSRNTPKKDGVAMDVAAANCLAHGRRYFVESFESFPEQCRHVLEELGVVFLVDRLARLMELTPAERLAFHQKQSGPVMESLKAWLGKQFKEKLVEPNSGLGRAIKYSRSTGRN